MTVRNIYPNILLRAQKLKVNLMSFELDINASQACICTIVKVKSLKVVLDSEIGQNSMQNLHFRA